MKVSLHHKYRLHKQLALAYLIIFFQMNFCIWKKENCFTTLCCENFKNIPLSLSTKCLKWNYHAGRLEPSFTSSSVVKSQTQNVIKSYVQLILYHLTLWRFGGGHSRNGGLGPPDWCWWGPPTRTCVRRSLCNTQELAKELDVSVMSINRAMHCINLTYKFSHRVRHELTQTDKDSRVSSLH